MATAEDIKLLFAEFDKSDIHWRAQSVTKDGSKAMALAYIDARDVMDRLDQVCGAGSWQDRYEFSGPKTICYLSILIDGEWVTKADGAGDTDVEADKGAISDAFKRAAVKWGIGRYLYDMPTPWVPCDSYQNNNGKYVWKKWKGDPWSYVKGVGASSHKQNTSIRELDADLLDCNTLTAVEKCAAAWREKARSERWQEDFKAEVAKRFERKRESLSNQDFLDDVSEAFGADKEDLKVSQPADDFQHPIMGG